MSPPNILGDTLYTLETQDRWIFGMLSSAMHMAWMDALSTKRGNSHGYLVGLIYNRFPWPNVSEDDKNEIRYLSENILSVRKKYPDIPFRLMYDPPSTPEDVSEAHYQLDIAVDRLYRKEPFLDDMERIDHLFGLVNNNSKLVFEE